jgi:hypothetical protein
MQDAMRSHARTASMASKPCPWCVDGGDVRSVGVVTCCVRHWSTKPRRRRAAAYAAAHGALGVLLAGIDVSTPAGGRIV